MKLTFRGREQLLDRVDRDIWNLGSEDLAKLMSGSLAHFDFFMLFVELAKNIHCYPPKSLLKYVVSDFIELSVTVYGNVYRLEYKDSIIVYDNGVIVSNTNNGRLAIEKFFNVCGIDYSAPF